MHEISTYRVFISHRYACSQEYRRLVRMLDRAAERDPTWQWENLSVPQEAPIMSREEAQRGEIYERRMRARMQSVHAILYILSGREWLDDVDSLYLELVEASMPLYRPQLPIINILPPGRSLEELRFGPPGVVTVKWNSRSIIRAIREQAIPASIEELRLTPAETAERDRIVKALQANGGRVGKTAAALGMSKSTLRRKRVAYIILQTIN